MGKSKTGGGQFLAGKRVTLIEVLPDHPRLKIIGVDTPHKEGEHVLWDRRNHLPLRESTIASYMRAGVVFAVLARKDEESGDLFIVDGRRRMLHAREANRRLKEQGSKLRILVKVQLDKRDLGMAAFLKSTLNEVREQNDPIARARDAVGDVERFGVEAVAEMYGVTTKQIKNWSRLLELCQEVQTALATNEITQKFALSLIGTPVAEQRTKIERMKAILAGKKKGSKRGAANKPREMSRIQMVKRSLAMMATAEKFRIGKDDGAVDVTLTDRERLLLQWVVGELDDDAVKAMLPLARVWAATSGASTVGN